MLKYRILKLYFIKLFYINIFILKLFVFLVIYIYFLNLNLSSIFRKIIQLFIEIDLKFYKPHFYRFVY